MKILISSFARRILTSVHENCFFVFITDFAVIEKLFSRESYSEICLLFFAAWTVFVACTVILVYKKIILVKFIKKSSLYYLIVLM